MRPYANGTPAHGLVTAGGRWYSPSRPSSGSRSLSNQALGEEGSSAQKRAHDLAEDRRSLYIPVAFIAWRSGGRAGTCQIGHRVPRRPLPGRAHTACQPNTMQFLPSPVEARANVAAPNHGRRGAVAVAMTITRARAWRASRRGRTHPARDSHVLSSPRSPLDRAAS